MDGGSRRDTRAVNTDCMEKPVEYFDDEPIIDSMDFYLPIDYVMMSRLRALREDTLMELESLLKNCSFSVSPLGAFDLPPCRANYSSSTI